MKENIPQKIRLGIFVIVGTLLLLAALFLVGKRQNLFNKNSTLYSTFSNVNGLQLGNNVYYSGIKAGTVQKIEIINPNVILVQMHIDAKVAKHIDKKATATISLSGLVGNMMVNIIPSNTISKHVISGDTIASFSKVSTNTMLKTLNTTNEKVAAITDNILLITNQIIEGKGTIGMLLNDHTMANEVKTTILQFKEASTFANNSLTKLNNVLAPKNFDKSVAAVLLSDTLSGNKIKKLITDLEASGESICSLSENLDQVALDLKSKNGALHFLTQDPKLVEGIDASIQNIKEGTAKFNTNMEALKSNFLFRKYFKKLETNNN